MYTVIDPLHLVPERFQGPSHITCNRQRAAVNRPYQRDRQLSAGLARYSAPQGLLERAVEVHITVRGRSVGQTTQGSARLAQPVSDLDRCTGEPEDVLCP